MKTTTTELNETIRAYSKEEQMYMKSLDKMSKVDLILYLNNLNNIRKIKKDKFYGLNELLNKNGYNSIHPCFYTEK